METNPGVANTFLATYTFPEIYDLIKKTFIDWIPKYPIDAKPLFIFESVPQMAGNTKQFDESDFSTFAKTKPEAVAAAKMQFGIGYHKVMKMKRIAGEFDLSYEARTQNQWYRVTEITAGLVEVCPQRINLDETHRVTFANATSYVDMDGFTIDTTTGDGLALADAAHTLAFSPTTYTNIVPGAPQFSKSALQSAETIAKNNIFDNFGIPKLMNFTHIFCANTPNVRENIKQFLGSQADVTQANPEVINTYKGKYEMLVLSQLDTDANGHRDTGKSNWWGIAALGGAIRGNRWQAYYGEWEAPHLKPAPTEENNASDFSKDIWRYGVRAGYGLTVVSPKGFIISLVP
jgi:hypothetical protein